MPPPAPVHSCQDCLHCGQRTLRLFCNLHAEALQEFNTLGTLSTRHRGDCLFEESSPISGVFVLCRGKVKLTTTSRQGKVLVLKIALPGEVLGLGAALSGSKHEVTAVALEPIQVKRIENEELLTFLSRHAEAGLHAAEVVSADYQSAVIGTRRLALSTSAGARLAGMLLEWGRVRPLDHQRDGSPSEMRFNMALTHEELAGLIGTTRETVTRTLSQFKRENLIAIQGATIVILAADRLEAMSA